MSHLPSNENSQLPVVSSSLASSNVEDLDIDGTGYSPCCSWATPRTLIASLSLLCVVSVCTAAYFAGAYHAQKASNTYSASELGTDFPILNATAAVSSDKFSMATGATSEDAEGLFVLDHNSGLLQCNVIYPRMGRFMARFQANVADALGSGGKGGEYMMVTGNANFPRSSTTPAAPSVVYVMDTGTGNYACYGIPFNRVLVSSGRPQEGALVLISSGSANPVIDRDNLR
jgi:hypothetical protein